MTYQSRRDRFAALSKNQLEYKGISRADLEKLAQRIAKAHGGTVDFRRQEVEMMARALDPASIQALIHYIFGGRRPATLSDFGVDDNFERHSDVRRVVSEFKQEILAEARRQAQSTCRLSSRGRRLSFTYNKRKLVNVLSDRA